MLKELSDSIIREIKSNNVENNYEYIKEQVELLSLDISKASNDRIKELVEEYNYKIKNNNQDNIKLSKITDTAKAINNKLDYAIRGGYGNKIILSSNGCNKGSMEDKVKAVDVYSHYIKKIEEEKNIIEKKEVGESLILDLKESIRQKAILFLMRHVNKESYYDKLIESLVKNINYID